MSSFSAFAQRFNSFLYRQHIQGLTASDIDLARQWSLDLIRREHKEMTDEEVEIFYDNLLYVRIIAVDEWSQRMN